MIKTTRLSWILFFTILFSILLHLPAEEGTIPFQYCRGLIIVPCRIDSAPEIYNFIVDTGGVTFIDKKLADTLQLKQRGQMAKITEMELSGVRIENVFCFTNFELGIFRSLPIPIRGIIGSNLLERFRVGFDFQSQVLTLDQGDEPLAPPQGGYVLKFRNHPVNSAPIIVFGSGQKNIEGMIDTGQPYPIVFPLDSLEEYRSLLDPKIIESNGLIEEWPMTSADHNYLARLKSFELPEMKSEHLLCLFAELPKPLSMPLLGMDFLRRFKITIDYPRDEITLIPVEGLSFPQNQFSAGFRPEVQKDDTIVIKAIWKGTPADLAGLRAGDIISSFHTQKYSGKGFDELWQVLRDDEIKVIHLEIKKQNGGKEIVLRKIRLFS
ncbi:MAG: hypothetical protein OEW18_13075 [Candidatus Aminicenantes bacterium]|nr:hypothetical protein [Candidatus Aminicenantes bacterium]